MSWILFPCTTEQIHQKPSWGFSERTTARVDCERINLTYHASAEILSKGLNLFTDKQNALYCLTCSFDRWFLAFSPGVKRQR